MKKIDEATVRKIADLAKIDLKDWSYPRIHPIQASMASTVNLISIRPTGPYFVQPYSKRIPPAPP